MSTFRVIPSQRRPDMSDSTPLYPVRIVAQKTGLTPDLLRAWERRYAVVQPNRSAGRQRLYGEAEVERLTLLRRAVDGGRTISEVAPLDESALRQLVERDERKRRRAMERPGPAIATDDGDSVLAAALLAVERFDADSMNTVLRRAAVMLSVDEMLDGVLGPLLFTIGSLWHQNLLRPAQEHMATQVIRGTLTWMMEQSTPGDAAPAVVVGTPLGQVHEMGAMLAAAAGVFAGWRVVYLGPNLPAAEIIEAARRANASALALSIVRSHTDHSISAELRAVREQLPGIAILAGGRSAPTYADVLDEIGAERPSSLAALRVWFRERLPAR